MVSDRGVSVARGGVDGSGGGDEVYVEWRLAIVVVLVVSSVTAGGVGGRLVGSGGEGYSGGGE